MSTAVRTAAFAAVTLALAESQARADVVPLGTAFAVSTQAGDATGGRPAIAGDGSNFFTVWARATSGVYGARITHDGTVLDGSGILIADNNSSVPSVAFDGTNYLVVWVSSDEIRAARVTPAGQVLDDPDLQLTSGASARARPITLAFDGSAFLVAWRTNGDDVRGLRVTPEGTVLDAATGFPIATGGGRFYPWVAFNGSHHLVVWHDLRGPGGSDWNVYAARVTPAGTVLEPDGFLVASPPQKQDHCSVASDGDGWLVVCHDWRPDANETNSSAYAARIAADGSVLDADMFQVASRVHGQTAPNVVFGGTVYIVAWMAPQEARFRLTDVYARRITPTGELLDPQAIPVATAYGHQFSPALGHDAGAYLAVWNESLSETRCSSGCIYGQVLVEQSPAAAVVPGASATPKRLPAKVLTAWRQEPSPTGEAITRIAGVDASHAYATSAVSSGSNNPLLRFDGTAWSVWHPGGPFRGRQFGLWAAGADDVHTNGWCWDVFHYDGQTLSASNCLAPGVGMALWGAGQVPRFAAGVEGTILEHDGMSWFGATSGTSFGLWDVWGSAEDNVLAVGERGTILRFDGTEWLTEPGVPTVQSLNAVWGTGADDVFAVGDWGTILHFDGLRHSSSRRDDRM